MEEYEKGEEGGGRGGREGGGREGGGSGYGAWRQIWNSALKAKWNVDLSIKGRGSVHGHQDYKKGICMKRLVLRGSNYVRDAFEEVLSLCDAGNVNFDDMYGTPLVMELCDKFKAESSAITGSSGRSSHPLSHGLDLVRLMKNSDDYDALSPVGEKKI